VRIFRICLTAALVSLVAAAGASAQDPGVFIDPGAPSAKEYALPFESERRQADPEQGPGAQIVPGARTSPTFGEGITSGNAPRSASSGGSRDTGERKDDAASEPRASDGEADVVRAAASNPGAPDGGTGVTLAIAGIAVGVLLAGGLAGLLWRRRA
jgi:hypothetical protein